MQQMLQSRNIQLLVPIMDDLLKYWILCAIKAVLFCADCIFEAILGFSITGGKKSERIRANEDYAHSAQVVNVLWRAKHTIYKLTRLLYFLYKHEKYVHPDYVLKNKHTSLVAVQEDYALFIETDPDVDIHDTEKFPFLFLAQYFQARKLIILPIKSFHRLADDIGDPKIPVAMVNMSARCGSTLISQVANKVPNTRVMSENWTTMNIHELTTSGKVSRDVSRRLLRSAVRLHCKISPDEKIERIFMKMTILNAPQFEDFAKLFPQIHYIFNTRHPVPSMRSQKQVIGHVETGLYYKLQFGWRELAGMNFSIPYGPKYEHVVKSLNKWKQNITYIQSAYLMYASVVATYFDHKDIYEHVILYENLVENPTEEVLKTFKILDIPEHHLRKALSALEKDSQNGTFGSQGGGRKLALSKEDLQELDGYLKDFDLPFRHDITVDDFKSLYGFSK